MTLSSIQTAHQFCQHRKIFQAMYQSLQHNQLSNVVHQSFHTTVVERSRQPIDMSKATDSIHGTYVQLIN